MITKRIKQKIQANQKWRPEMAEIPTEVERLRAENEKLRERNIELEVALADAKARASGLYKDLLELRNLVDLWSPKK